MVNPSSHLFFNHWFSLQLKEEAEKQENIVSCQSLFRLFNCILQGRGRLPSCRYHGCTEREFYDFF